jgi:flagellar basal body rod protein FlgC
VKNLVSLWSTKRMDKNGYEIKVPVVDDEQISRVLHWKTYLESCSVNKVIPSRKEFERMYQPTPDDVA